LAFFFSTKSLITIIIRLFFLKKPWHQGTSRCFYGIRHHSKTFMVILNSILHWTSYWRPLKSEFSRESKSLINFHDFLKGILFPLIPSHLYLKIFQVCLSLMWIIIFMAITKQLHGMMTGLIIRHPQSIFVFRWYLLKLRSTLGLTMGLCMRIALHVFFTFMIKHNDFCMFLSQTMI